MNEEETSRLVDEAFAEARTLYPHNVFDLEAEHEREQLSPEASEIRRAAELSPIEYDHQRETLAETLGIRVGTLDKEVAKVRKSSASGQGRPIEFNEIEPWSESLDGSALLDEMAEAISRYVVLPPTGADVVALWCLHAHALEAARITPGSDCARRRRVAARLKPCGSSNAWSRARSRGRTQRRRFYFALSKWHTRRCCWMNSTICCPPTTASC
jgi:hypothetical protein